MLTTEEKLNCMENSEEWGDRLDEIKEGMDDFENVKRRNLKNPEQYLNEILPTYWEVFHTHNAYEKRQKLLPDLNYDIGIFLVGFSSLPIALSLAEIQPTEKIYFLYSNDTKPKCYEIANRMREMLNGQTGFDALIDRVDTIALDIQENNDLGCGLEIDDPSDPVKTFKRIKEVIDKVGDKRIALDLTGGKKTMIGGGFTAGSILGFADSIADSACDMFYIDSLEYNQRQGSPTPGTEFLTRLDNPYNVYNVQSTQQAKKLFEKHNYEAATDLWEEVAKKLTTSVQGSKSPAEQYGLKDEEKMVQSNLAMANCYKLWDTFDYNGAKNYKSFSFYEPDAQREFRGSWGYNDKHGHNLEDDILEILSSASNRQDLFTSERRIVHCAADYYQNAIRRKESGELNDALVHFTQVIEILCSYKICRGIFLITEQEIPTYFLEDPGTPRGLINFFFGSPNNQYRNRYEVDSNEFLEIQNYDGFNRVSNITDLIKYRNNFVHVNKAMRYETTLQNANKLECFSAQLLEAFSFEYCSNQGLSFQELLELHRFRSASLNPIEQLVEELNYLSNSEVDQERVTQIYNEKFQSIEGDAQRQIAQALKVYWQDISKWKNGSEKQRKKVMEVKSILGEH